VILFRKTRYNVTHSGFYYCYCVYFCYKLVTLSGFSYLFFLMSLTKKIPHQNYSKSPSFFYPNNKTAFQKIIFLFTYTVTFTAFIPKKWQHLNYPESPSFFYPNNKTAFQKIIFSFTYTVTFTAFIPKKSLNFYGIILFTKNNPKGVKCL